eukprot:CAMPEP_0181367474 /NCGR_PEP_ID=MMETSP1106-20121128/11429_1 /TAXON_ID=81844 /ORGANISM="Mantoniella antarctica, Strain SL-175" /LENGTH=731 /DNA_ID=CAMNT_0023483237 /DNA_START=149 /DNA_END=2344 /DNA_ORIENTATION=+
MAGTEAEALAAPPGGASAEPAGPSPFELKAPYYAKRIRLFEQYFAREGGKMDAAAASPEPIQVVMPDGAIKDGVKNVTTPWDVAMGIHKKLAQASLLAHVDGADWDMRRPLEGNCALKLFSFDDPEGKALYWHSSAHVLGEALELEYGADLTIGPSIEEGFYYDCYLGERTLSDYERAGILKRCEAIIKDKQPFQRVEVSRAEALEMFAENKFKVELITNLPDGVSISCYRCGPMVDLCRGPHLPDTAWIKAVTINQCSRAHWRADVTKDPLVRVYAITFPSDKLMKEYKTRIEEAKKRDHRVIGMNQELFFFHNLSPGSCFFLPDGAKVYNNLMGFIREKYWEYEYDEVITPNIFNFDLWKTSGHAAHYKENMFSFHVEKEEFGLKPMNCPGHCVMFGNRKRSFRELPMRLADFGVLHRNEFSGALHGLTRVRRFQQDDAHIFCRPDQMEFELVNFLKLMDEVYSVFGLTYEMKLSTRPEGYLGEIEIWDQAEAALTKALNLTGKEWKLNPGDGAFYGPKIDITVFDALKRRFQCATVQLDFQLPIRFNLSYVTENNEPARPIIIHRAILGSVERMFAILTEHYAGKWPYWLSPRQVMIVPISEASKDYAGEVRRMLHHAGHHVKVDNSDRKMQKKVREAQLEQWNYILVVGEGERTNGTVNVRTRDNVVHGEHKLDALLEVLSQEREVRSLTCMFGMEKSAAAAAVKEAAEAEAAAAKAAANADQAMAA